MIHDSRWNWIFSFFDPASSIVPPASFLPVPQPLYRVLSCRLPRGIERRHETDAEGGERYEQDVKRRDGERQMAYLIHIPGKGYEIAFRNDGDRAVADGGVQVRSQNADHKPGEHEYLHNTSARCAHGLQDGDLPALFHDDHG